MTNNKLFKFIFIVILLVNLTGVFNSIFIADSALYAAISKLMATSGNWLEIFVDGYDWLDKPHFPFWMSAISMKIFGVNAFGYKFPSFVFFILSLFYTYKFSLKVYSKEVALVAVLIVSSAMHILVSNNDVRAEATMVGLIIASTYHFYNLIYKFSIKDILLAALFGAATIMTKGIFVLIPIAAAIFGEIAFKKQWHILFKWRWVWSILLMFVFIIPELWAIYYQFDMNPGDAVFNPGLQISKLENVSGLKFFFWDSQFGRFFNTGPITGTGDPFFFVHTLLWAFAPWAVLAYAALFVSIKRIVKRESLKEYANLFGFLTMMIIFSLSKFQLPHYANILFPYLAIIVADYIVNLKAKGIKFFMVSQIVNIALFTVISFVLFFYFRPGPLWMFLLILVLSVSIVYYIFQAESNTVRRFIYLSVVVSIYIGLFLNIIFYPKLHTYQSGTNAGKYVNEHFPEAEVASTFYSGLFEFYINQDLIRIKGQEQLKDLDENTVVFVQKSDLERFDKNGINYEVVESFKHFHITRLTPNFLNPETREGSLQERYLVKMIKNHEE